MTSARSSKGPYSKYYEKLGEDRNDLLRNPEVLFQSFAIDRANIAALRSLSLDKRTARVLDVGCGSGSGLLQFVRLGFVPTNLAGIDLNDARIEEGKALLPGIDLQVADASRMTPNPRNTPHSTTDPFTGIASLNSSYIARNRLR